ILWPWPALSSIKRDRQNTDFRPISQNHILYIDWSNIKIFVENSAFFLTHTKSNCEGSSSPGPTCHSRDIDRPGLRGQELIGEWFFQGHRSPLQQGHSEWIKCGL